MTLPLESSLQGLRESVYAMLDQAPQSSASTELFVNRFINQAVQRLALDLPYAFHEEYVRLYTDYEFASQSATDTMELITISDGDDAILDPWTLRMTNNIAVGPTILPVDRSLDGAFIELTDSDGVKRTNQIRSVWLENDFNGNASDDVICLTLMRPFPAFHDRDTINIIADSGPFLYRIFHPYLWLPDEILQIKNMRVVGRGESQMQVISQDLAEKMGIDDYNYTQQGGTPRYAYRRGHFQLPAPSTAPTVQTATAAGLSRKWQGPEPYGSFQYCWTIAWGKKDYDDSAFGKAAFNLSNGFDQFIEQESDFNYNLTDASFWAGNRVREPLFESAPSPVSDTFTVADPGALNQVDAAVLTFPNISYQLGFMFTGGSFAGAFDRIADSHSGFHIRIYRRRVTTQIGAGYATLNTETSSQNITSLKMLEDDDAFHLHAEMRIDASNAGQFVDDGYILPDHLRRLREIHGYQAIRLHPTPDARYEIEARVVKRPPILVNDTDRPAIDPVACEAIVLYAAYLERGRQGIPSEALRLKEEYKEALRVIGRRYADMRPAGQPARVRPASSRRRRGLGYRAGHD